MPTNAGQVTAGPLPVLRTLGYDILRITEGGEAAVIRVSPRMEGANMGKLGGSGLLIAGIVLAFLGIVLRTGLIKWLIDFTGLILIILGIVLIVIGVIQMFSGRGRGSSMDF